MSAKNDFEDALDTNTTGHYRFQQVARELSECILKLEDARHRIDASDMQDDFDKFYNMMNAFIAALGALGHIVAP